jgi:hypothetical protein
MSDEVFKYEIVDDDGDMLTVYSDGTWRWSLWSDGELSRWKIEDGKLFINHCLDLDNDWEQDDSSFPLFDNAFADAVVEWELLGGNIE